MVEALMGSEGNALLPILIICHRRADAMKKRNGRSGKPIYRRIRGDSGQLRRTGIAMILLGAVAFVPVIGQLYRLMVADHGQFSELALRNQSRSTAITARRGDIFDRNMNILASSKTVENVYIDPRELHQTRMDLDGISKALAEILDVDAARVRKLADDQSRRYHLIADRVEEKEAALVRQYINDNHITGIHLEPNTRRYYPYGTRAAQVIGFTNASNDGAEGIEASYDELLAGEPGRVATTKGNNEMDMPYSVERYLAGKTGASVITTLDMTVQACLEQGMQEAIDRYRVLNGAFGMVMDVDTGEILAMATLGSYDPNNYLEIGDPGVKSELEQLRLNYLRFDEESAEYADGKAAYRQALVNARLKQWRNRCLSDGYEPGSTFKTITLAAAIDCGAVDLNSHFSCSGAEQIPGRSQLLHCWRSAGHGGQTTAQALQNSCNLAFAHIGLKLGGERFYEYIQAFGITQKTGIDLAGESAGVFFSKELITDTDKWGTSSLTSGSFGQTFKVTPLQLVRAIAAVVNGGYLLEPYIVSEVIDADGNILLKQEPTVLSRPISEKTSELMRGMIESVVTEGTAKNAAVSGFRVGGKTGTSEKIDVFDENGQRVQDKIVSFVGIAPMDEPRYIILVALDTPSRETGMYISGGVMAAPTVGAVLEDILPYLEVTRSYPEGDPAGTVVTVPDLTGMTKKEAEKALDAIGLSILPIGDADGVTGQLPAPGETIQGGSKIILYFGDAPREEDVSVPDFSGMTVAQANVAAADAGLCLRSSGNPDLTLPLTVLYQNIAPGTDVEPGSVITLTFTDPTARD